MEKRQVISIAAFILCGVLLLCGCRAKGITGEEWVKYKYEMMDDIQAMAANIDDIVTLYTINAISTEDYDNEIMIARKTYDLLKASDKTPEVRPGGHTEDTQKAMAAYDNIWKQFDRIMELLYMGQ